MKRLYDWGMIITALALLAWMFQPNPAHADALAGATLDAYKEYRKCGEPRREISGKIARSSGVIRAFRALYPCPGTGLKIGACPGWAIDHVIPLAVGGCDAVFNMQWLPDGAKNVKGELAKDRWERTVYK